MKHRFITCISTALLMVFALLLHPAENPKLRATPASAKDFNPKSPKNPSKQKDTFIVTVNKKASTRGVFYEFCTFKDKQSKSCVKNNVKPEFMDSDEQIHTYSHGFSVLLQEPFSLRKKAPIEYVRLVVSYEDAPLQAIRKGGSLTNAGVVFSDPVEQRTNEKGEGSLTFTIEFDHRGSLLKPTVTEGRTWTPIESRVSRVTASLKKAQNKILKSLSEENK